MGGGGRAAAHQEPCRRARSHARTRTHSLTRGRSRDDTAPPLALGSKRASATQRIKVSNGGRGRGDEGKQEVSEGREGEWAGLLVGMVKEGGITSVTAWLALGREVLQGDRAPVKSCLRLTPPR